MYKIISLFLLVSLTGCIHQKSQEEIENEIRNNYVRYSCPQLHQKYLDIKTKCEEERASRQTMNAVNAVVGVLAVVGGGGGAIGYNSKSYAEHNYETEMKVIENLALDKRCKNVSF